LKGATELHAAIDAAKASVEKLTTSLNVIGKQATVAFAALSASVGAFAIQGLHASAMGDLLRFQMERLSLSVAGLFGPEIRKAIGLVADLTNWLGSLSEAQRGAIAHFVEAAAVGLAFAKVLPLLTGGLKSLVALFAGAGIGSALIASFDSLVESGQTFAAAVAPLLQAVQHLFESLGQAIAPIVDVVANALAPVLVVLADAINLVATALDDGNAKWLVAVAAAWGTFQAYSAVVTLIPKMIALVNTLTAALKAQAVVETVLAALKGNFAGLAIAAAAGIATFAALSAAEKSADEKGKKGAQGNRGALARKSYGPENLGSAFDRIARASVAIGFGGAGAPGGTAGKPPEEQQVDEQKKTNLRLERIEGILHRAHPFLV
jgi:hypothetical protein